MQYCTNCGIKLIISGKFCSECGFKLNKKGDFCFICGAKLYGSGNFCSECGTKMSLIKINLENHNDIKTQPEISRKDEQKVKSHPKYRKSTTHKEPFAIKNDENGVVISSSVNDNKLLKIENIIEFMVQALEQNDPNLAKEYLNKALKIDKFKTEIEISNYQTKISGHFADFAKAEFENFKSLLEEWKRPKYPHFPDFEWRAKMQIGYSKANNSLKEWILFDPKNAETYYIAGLVEKIYAEMRSDYYSHDRKKWFAIEKRAKTFFDKALEINPNFQVAPNLKE